MKYLKLFEELVTAGKNRTQIKAMFELYIDWDMIADIKEEALDYIDDEYTLHINVAYEDIIIYLLIYNHVRNLSHWLGTLGYERASIIGGFNLPYESDPDEDVDKSKIVYRVKLFKSTGAKSIHADDSFYDTIKNMYPDANIEELEI